MSELVGTGVMYGTGYCPSVSDPSPVCIGTQSVLVPLENLNARARQSFRAAVTNADRFSPLDSTLVIVLLRNVYDWTEAMRRLPYHSPSHVNLTLDELLQASVSAIPRSAAPRQCVA